MSIADHPLFPHLITVAGLVIGLAVAWGKLSSRLDGIEQYKEVCQDNRADCQDKVYGELAKITAAVNRLSDQKEHRWEELDKNMANIYRFIGRVDQYMIMKNGIIPKKDD